MYYGGTVLDSILSYFEISKNSKIILLLNFGNLGT